MEPNFRKRKDGKLSLIDSTEAVCVKSLNKEWTPPIDPDKVRKQALESVRLKGGNTGNLKHVIGQHTLQFGHFRYVLLSKKNNMVVIFLAIVNKSDEDLLSNLDMTQLLLYNE